MLDQVPLIPQDSVITLAGIDSFVNHRDGSENTLQAHDLCTVEGQNLSYDSSIEAEGIFFVSETDGAETKVTEILKTKRQNIRSSRVSFKAPGDLSAGEYKLVIRKNSTQKQPLFGYLEHTLTVM